MFNEASKIIGSLTVFVFVSILQVFSLIYIYFWFYDPNFNVSNSENFFINWRKIFPANFFVTYDLVIRKIIY